MLGDKASYERCLEIGTAGRYPDFLEKGVLLTGEKFFVAEKPATYSIADILDRGQIVKAGEFISLDDYYADIDKLISPNTL